MLTVAHLTASRFFGGPERQILELAAVMGDHCRSVLLLFPEDGTSRAFREASHERMIESNTLQYDFPRLISSLREVVDVLRGVGADVLCTHGYKANLIGYLAASRLGIPVVAVSRGWTGENVRVRCYEAFDRRVLRWMDAVVCVSECQAEKVRRSGVRPDKVKVVQNAVRADRFAAPQAGSRERLLRLFKTPPDCIVGAAGRLSPEKGFEVLVDAAAEVLAQCPRSGFVVYGDGVLRNAIEAQIRRKGLHDSFVLAGFCPDLDQYLPEFDIVALPSFTEGLPNVALEAMAAGRPVVGTAVGGIPEVVRDGDTGFIVPPGSPTALAERIVDLIRAPEKRRAMGEAGRLRVERGFGFAAQASQYDQLFKSLLVHSEKVSCTRPDVDSVLGETSLHG